MYREYETGMHEARSLFEAKIQPILAETDAKTLIKFLILFNAQGVGMTKDVPRWIKTAGENSIELGFKELGRALVVHSEHEAGHHLLMEADVKVLVDYWNREFVEAKLTAESILTQPLFSAVLEYQMLHENTLSKEPYCQIAIEYEIERVSVGYGQKFISHCVHNVGPQVVSGLSFVKDHAELDVGHTKYNKSILERFINQNPSKVSSLIRSGSMALNCYQSYVRACLEAAKGDVLEEIVVKNSNQ